MKNVIYGVLLFGLGIFLAGCCKDKDGECLDNAFSVKPFTERFYVFRCNNNDVEYSYVLRSREQIDSLQPVCFFTAPVAFPIDEIDMLYIALGKMSYHYSDTFKTNIIKDTCNKLVTYDVQMIQRDTTLFQFPGIISMYCAVENIPADYRVEVKYKYVPLPE